jgi:hypothetical protein
MLTCICAMLYRLPQHLTMWCVMQESQLPALHSLHTHLNKPSSLIPPHHMKENVALHVNAVIDFDDLKPQMKTWAQWNAPCDSILLDTLAGVKAQGWQADNAGRHSDAYIPCVEKLQGTEMKNGGLKKTAKMCLTWWTAICFVCNKFMTAYGSHTFLQLLCELSGWG